MDMVCKCDLCWGIYSNSCGIGKVRIRSIQGCNTRNNYNMPVMLRQHAGLQYLPAVMPHWQQATQEQRLAAAGASAAVGVQGWQAKSIVMCELSSGDLLQQSR